MITRVTRLLKVLCFMSAIIALPTNFNSGQEKISPHEKDGWKAYGFLSKCLMCHAKNNKQQKSAESPRPNKAESILPVIEVSAERPSLYEAKAFPSKVAGLLADDPSITCLSCHDGVIAVAVGISNRDRFMALHNQGGSHPIGIDYYDAKMNHGGAGLKDPDTIFPGNPKNVRVRDVLWNSKIVTCTSCHDPHGLNSVAALPEQTNHRLYGPQKDSLICAGCHDLGGN